MMKKHRFTEKFLYRDVSQSEEIDSDTYHIYDEEASFYRGFLYRDVSQSEDTYHIYDEEASLYRDGYYCGSKKNVKNNNQWYD